MPDQAKVTSLEALEKFRSNLIVYLERAKRALDEVSEEVMRTRIWLQDERREHWQREIRRRAKKLEEKQQELFSAELANLREPSEAERHAVVQARRALNEAQERFEVVKKWNRQYASRVEPLAKEVDKLRDVIVSHMGKGVAYLTQTTKTLADYAGIAPRDIASQTNSTVENPPIVPSESVIKADKS
jgi:hypothetical protein